MSAGLATKRKSWKQEALDWKAEAEARGQILERAVKGARLNGFRGNGWQNSIDYLIDLIYEQKEAQRAHLFDQEAAIHANALHECDCTGTVASIQNEEHNKRIAVNGRYYQVYLQKLKCWKCHALFVDIWITSWSGDGTRYPLLPFMPTDEQKQQYSDLKRKVYAIIGWKAEEISVVRPQENQMACYERPGFPHLAQLQYARETLLA